MKRWLAWILILVFLISGCSDQPETPTEATVATQPKSTEPARTIHWDGSALEKASDGAVTVYGISDTDINGMGFLGGDPVILTSREDDTLLTRFDAQTGEVKVEKTISGKLYAGGNPSSANAAMEGNRLAYYDAQENVVRFLDASFKEVSKVKLQQEPEGNPLISGDLSTAFYCVGGEIRAMDLQTGIARLVCQRADQVIFLMALILNDSVLCCLVTENGKSRVDFLNAENGLLLESDANLLTIESRGDTWLVSRLDGTTEEILTGNSENVFSFTLDEAENSVLRLLPGGIAAWEISDENAWIRLYDTENGNCLKALKLAEVEQIHDMLEDPSGSCVWFVASDKQTKQDVLCRWDTAASAGGDETVRIATRYTAKNPDVATLQTLKQEAQAIGKKYGVQIHLADDVPQVEGYTIIHEYQTRAFEKALAELDRILARFPEGFLTTMADRNTDKQLHIGLIRSAHANAVGGNPKNDGLYSFVDGSAWITLCVGDGMELSFYRNLSHALDTYVYSNSIHYDFWSDCNPDDFQYDENYLYIGSHEGSPYLSGKSRAFIDAFSMTFPHEDRATVFAYAMMAGTGDYFESDYMQAKLKQLSMGIRQAFGWEAQEITLVWEQYLLAP